MAEKPTKAPQAVLAAPHYDATNWRTKLRMSKVRMSDDEVAIYLEHYADHGLGYAAAREAGVHYHTIQTMRKNDPDFDTECAVAEACYAERVGQVVRHWTFNPIVKESYDRNGELVGRITEPAVKMIEMEAKRTTAGYRDRSHLDIDVKHGGVLVAPSFVSPSDWVKQVEANEVDKRSPIVLALEQSKAEEIAGNKSGKELGHTTKENK